MPEDIQKIRDNFARYTQFIYDSYDNAETPFDRDEYMGIYDVLEPVLNLLDKYIEEHTEE